MFGFAKNHQSIFIMGKYLSRLTKICFENIDITLYQLRPIEQNKPSLARVNSSDIIVNIKMKSVEYFLLEET